MSKKQTDNKSENDSFFFINISETLGTNTNSGAGAGSNEKPDEFQALAKAVQKGPLPYTVVDRSKMDTHNQKAMDVAAKDGTDAFIKHVFTDQETGRKLTYAEMRSRYG